MLSTSALYKSIVSGQHTFEAEVVIGEKGMLMTENKSVITFGGTPIWVANYGAECGYRQNVLRSLTISRQIFSDNTVEVGKCISAEIDIEMTDPSDEIPPMAQITPYVRATDGVRYSEWLQKGVFFIDTREIVNDGYASPCLKIHGYDAMLMTEQDYPNSSMVFPATDIAVVTEIANALGLTVASHTWAVMVNGYSVQYPSNYTCRETLGYIAAMYLGNFVIDDAGELLLISLTDLPKETRYLTDNIGCAITFGGDRICV